MRFFRWLCAVLPSLTAMSTRKVRVKKLNVKTPLPVLREGDIDPSEYESLTTESQIATGVEAAEETVSHVHRPSHHSDITSIIT